MRTFLLAATLAMLSPVALAIPITGDGCGSDGGPGVGIVDTGMGYYVEGRSNGAWIWQETNGVAGPQWLNTDSALIPGDHYSCGVDDPSVESDTLIA